MQWYVYLITISATAFLGQIAVELISRPIWKVYRLRREALDRMRSFGNRPLPRPRELAISSREIREYGQAVRTVREAQRTFGDLGAQFLALGESEPATRILMALFGLNIALAGQELINLSEVFAMAKTDGGQLRREIKRALHATGMALAVSRRRSRNDVTKIRLEPMRLQSAGYPRR